MSLASSTPSEEASEVTFVFPGPGGQVTGTARARYTGNALKLYLKEEPLRTYGLITKLTRSYKAYTGGGVRMKLRDVPSPGEVVVFIRNR